MKLLVILGHPRKDSLCGALANAFVDGARQANVELRELILSDLSFDPNVHHPSPNDQLFENDIKRAQELIRWADHLVFVYPNWWGTMPALQKGFLDRIITPGFAFAESADGKGWVQLLTGKTAQLITTMDMPRWVYRLIFRQPGNNAMKRATLGFCGVRTVRILNLGPVKDADAVQRARWLERARGEGRRLSKGVLTPVQRAGDKLLAWLSALRLQFYPMAWISYTVGALAGSMQTGVLTLDAYWVGYFVLFFLEAATVFSNDYFDFAADRTNQNYGPFNGGARVLVEERLSFRELRYGIMTAIVLSISAAGGLLFVLPGDSPTLVLILAVMFVVTLGYTVPPLRLVYRSLGEIDVGLTHSIGVLLCGYIIQGGSWADPYPWLISIPLFFSILPAIILSNIPDYESDVMVAKRTLPVLIGPRRAIVLAMLFTVTASLTAVILQATQLLYPAYGNVIYLLLLHACLLTGLLYFYLQRYRVPERIDGLMVAALTYIIWFGVVPLIALS